MIGLWIVGEHGHLGEVVWTLKCAEGLGGIPNGLLTLVRGHASSGKLVVSLNMLAGIQRSSTKPVAVIDLAGNIDGASFARSGVDIEHLIVARPVDAAQALNLMSDLLKAGDCNAVMLNSLSELLMDSSVRRLWSETLAHLTTIIRMANIPVIWLYDPSPVQSTATALFDVSGVQQSAGVVLGCSVARAWLDEFAQLVLAVDVRCERSRHKGLDVARIEVTT